MMNRRSKKKATSNWHLHRLVIVLVVMTTVIGSGVVGYQYHKHPKQYPGLMAFSAKVDKWWLERKARIASVTKSQENTQKLASAKPKTKSHANEAESVHFEFYTMLSNSGAVNVAQPNNDREEKVKSIFNQDSLEREFAQELTKTTYVVQTGLFSNAELADKAQQVLAKEGLASKVVKAYMDDHLVYRIQMGPYEEKDKLNEVQAKLAARGMHGTIHKTEEKLA